MGFPTAPPASAFLPPTMEYHRQGTEEGPGGYFGGTLPSSYPYTEAGFPSYFEEKPPQHMTQPSSVDESTQRKQQYRLLFSLFVAMFCCCPIGLAAIYYNLQVNNTIGPCMHLHGHTKLPLTSLDVLPFVITLECAYSN